MRPGPIGVHVGAIAAVAVLTGLCDLGAAAAAPATAADAPRVAATLPGEESPTWSTLYTRYLAAGTVGDCAGCHVEASTAWGTYAWLASQGYMSGTPYLVDPRTSCFSWLGGDMPPDGPSRYDRARLAFATWANAGASP